MHAPGRAPSLFCNLQMRSYVRLCPRTLTAQVHAAQLVDTVSPFACNPSCPAMPPTPCFAPSHHPASCTLEAHHPASFSACCQPATPTTRCHDDAQHTATTAIPPYPYTHTRTTTAARPPVRARRPARPRPGALRRTRLPPRGAARPWSDPAPPPSPPGRSPRGCAWRPRGSGPRA